MVREILLSGCFGIIWLMVMGADTKAVVGIGRLLSSEEIGKILKSAE